MEQQAERELQTSNWLDEPSLTMRVSDQRKADGRLEPYPGMRAVGNEFPGSPYVIQGESATVRGQTKLLDEGEPQGGNR